MTPSSSPLITRRSMVMGAVLAGVGGVAMARQPRPESARIGKETLERLVPTRIGDWTFRDSSGLVLPPPDALSDALYSGIVTRTYVAPDRMPMMLLIAYSNVQDGMLQVHRPEFCYPAGGYRLSPTVAEAMPDGVGGIIPANTFSADGVSRTEQVLYWTRVGAAFPTTWLAQRVAVLRANLNGVIPDGVLVRVSTLAPDMASARGDLTAFAAQLVRTAPPPARRLLVGTA